MIIRSSTTEVRDGIAYIGYEFEPPPNPRWQSACDDYLTRFRVVFDAQAEIVGDFLTARVADVEGARARRALDSVIVAANEAVEAEH